MDVTLNLNNPMWNTAARKAILDKAVRKSAVELEKEIKKKILNSVPAGRLYKKGAITRAATKKNLALGFRRVKGNANRVIVGYKFHRASKKGQSPATLSGALVNSIRARRIAIMKHRVASSKKYAPVLDSPQGLNRPFFKSVANKYRPKFKQNIQQAIAQNP